MKACDPTTVAATGLSRAAGQLRGNSRLRSGKAANPLPPWVILKPRKSSPGLPPGSRKEPHED